jgi:hypothetical protein
MVLIRSGIVASQSLCFLCIDAVLLEPVHHRSTAPRGASMHPGFSPVSVLLVCLIGTPPLVFSSWLSGGSPLGRGGCCGGYGIRELIARISMVYS